MARKLGSDLLVLGDRVGSLHVYRTVDLGLLTTFKKVHGRNGVTDIVTERLVKIFFAFCEWKKDLRMNANPCYL